MSDLRQSTVLDEVDEAVPIPHAHLLARVERLPDACLESQSAGNEEEPDTLDKLYFRRRRIVDVCGQVVYFRLSQLCRSLSDSTDIIAQGLLVSTDKRFHGRPTARQLHQRDMLPRSVRKEWKTSSCHQEQARFGRTADYYLGYSEKKKRGQYT